YDYPPVAVENPSPRRQDRDRLDAVLLCSLIVELRVLHLQLPEARDQEEENPHREVLEDCNLARREPGIVAQGRLAGGLLFEVWIDWRQGHRIALPAL